MANARATQLGPAAPNDVRPWDVRAPGGRKKLRARRQVGRRCDLPLPPIASRRNQTATNVVNHRDWLSRGPADGG